jgi:hypothetical protein
MNWVELDSGERIPQDLFNWLVESWQYRATVVRLWTNKEINAKLDNLDRTKTN